TDVSLDAQLNVHPRHVDAVFLSACVRGHLRPHSFPTRRSSDLTWPRFLGEWEEGRHQARYEQAEKTDMTTVPTPRFDLLKMRHRSEEHTSELQSRFDLVCRLLLEKKNTLVVAEHQTHDYYKLVV